MGLSGVMIWAIDLDNTVLDALNAVVDAEAVNATDMHFDLVDLAYLFPKEMLPQSDTPTKYGLVTLGHSINPADGGFSFMLVTGDSSAVSSLKKRDGEVEPFVFLDCPQSI
jgi:chitinase